MITPLRELPWWTDADQAELALLTHMLVTEAYDHFETTGCTARTCPHLAAAVDDVQGWMRWRELQSRAAWMRDRQDFNDWTRRAVNGRREEPAT